MARLTINIGTVANDGTGDTLRSAFDKTNQNFTELYNTTVTLAESINAVSNAILEETDPVFLASPAYDLTDEMISHINDAYNWGDHAAAGYITNVISSNFIPNSDNEYDLGAPDKQWRSLYVSANTIFIGGTPLSVDGGGNLLVDGSQVSGGSANTGDITFDGVKILGAGTASGDGNGYSTIELVPDADLYDNDQYLIIDPTEPQHIHIRAGGTIDASSAALYLGGELNYVRVIDYTGVRLQNNTRNDTFYNFIDPTDFNTATWFQSGGTNFVQYTAVNAEIGNLAFTFGDDNENTVTVTLANSETYTLTYGGSSSNLGGGVYRFAVVEAPPESPLSISAMDFVIWTIRTNSATLSNNDFSVSVTDDIRIEAADIFSLRNVSRDEPIEIRTDYDNADYVWAFNANGTLTFPDSTIQTTAWTGTVTGTISATAAAGTTETTAAGLGYIGMPQNTITTNYTLVAGDQGKHIYVTNAEQTITVPANGTTAFPIGTTIAIIAGPAANPVTIAIESDTMYLGGVGSTGNRTLTAYGMATLVKVDTTTWFINGSGLS